MNRLFNVDIVPESIKNVIAVLKNGNISEGKIVEEFERELYIALGLKNLFTVNSGTSALHLSLILAGVKVGDEVILPAQTFIATGLAILYCGAKPVFADINPITGLIDLDSIKEKITSKTKAVIMVHWAGVPADIDAINKFCQPLGIKTIEDAAHALGSIYGEYYIGEKTISDFICFSFQAIKDLTTGDGGAVVCKSPLDHEHGKRLRWFGIDKNKNLSDETGEREYNLTEVGYKYHMNNIDAAIGLGQLLDLYEIMRDRSERLNVYNVYFPRPYLNYNYKSSYWLYPILTNNRNKLRNELLKMGIESSVVHQGIDRNDIFGGLDKNLINQREYESKLLCIPTTLGSEQMAKIYNSWNQLQ